MKLFRFAIGIAVLGLAVQTASAADFYEGKTITFIGGLAVGGGSDIGCRLIAQYMGKHVAGNPTIIVKNMPSTDGIVAANYVGKDAKKDGLTMYCGAFGPIHQVLKDPAVQVDYSKFEYIMGDGDSGICYIRSDVAPGLKTADDLFKATNIIVGGTAVNSAMDISVRGYLDLLGLKYKYVVGFTGSGAARASIQQKFINLIQEGIDSYLDVTVPSMVKSGEVIPLYQTGDMDADNHLYLADKRAAPLPSFAEFYKAKFGKYPSGPEWDLEETIHGLQNVGVNVLMLPPGSPPEAVAAMRASVEPLNQDQDFVAASDKVRGEGKVEASWQEVQGAYQRFLDMSPELITAYNAMITSGQAIAEKNK